jgi:hypothetical protein
VNYQPKVAERIARCVLLALSTNRDGEALAALAAARRALDGASITIHDFADAVEHGLAPEPTRCSPPPPPDDLGDWRTTARHCDRHRHLLSERDAGFLATILRYRHQPSPSQLKWLDDIRNKLQLGG